ncbi:MAG TPA: tetratricopeptide repeat protein [Kofleriaceae bacterium]|nr:tetratricopeptide repeat protein [Kofleriaceae bacterium]
MKRVVALLLLAGCPRPAPVAPTPPPLSGPAYAHYVRGRVAAYEGDYALAAEELRAAAAAAPDEPRIEVERIRALVKAGRKVDARAAITAAERRWPQSVDVWIVDGDLARARGALADARTAYERATSIDPSREEAYLGLAQAYAGLHRNDLAEATWKQLLEHVPDSIEGHFRLGERLAETDPHGAEQHLRAVLEQNPDHIDARLDLAHVLRATGRLPDAIAETRRAFDRAGATIDIGEELFWLLLEADDRVGALDLLGLYDAPDIAVEVRVIASRLYLSIDELASARAQAEAALAAEPSSGEAALALARVERAAGDRDGARTRAEAIPSTSPAYGAARALAAELALDGGDADRAITIVEPARAAAPTDPELLLLYARALAARNRAADARAAIAAAVRAKPDDAALLFTWAQFEDAVGETDQAIAVIDRLLAAHPDHVDALNLAGFALAEKGVELDRAEKLLARARALAPGDPLVLDSWGWLLHKRGRDRDAAAALDRATRAAPRQPEILLHLGEVRAALGDPAGARKALEAARALSPPPALAKRIDARLAALPARP